MIRVSMRKRSSRVRELYDKLMSNEVYTRVLTELLETLEYGTLEDMVKTTNTDELLRLQGQARSIGNLRANLSRTPVEANLSMTGEYK